MVEKGRYFLFVLVAFFLVTLMFSFVKSDTTVPTEVNISNSPPMLNQNIPNQTWQAHTNLTNAFNLNDYFSDPNGDNLIFYVTHADNITITISSNGSVSFYPDENFLGVRTVTFTASDGTFNTTSNLVYLNAGVDSTPPKWYSPYKNPATVYQNAYVNFSTHWTDDFGLASWIFSINQGSGWSNHSGTFSGLVNNSKYNIQISAAAGKTVSWYFCASDTSANQNCTTLENFTVSEQPSPPPGNNNTIGNYTENFTQPPAQKVSNFTYTPTLFKIALKQGGSQTRILKVSNIGTSNISFSLDAGNIDSFVTLSDTYFVLGLGQSKSITIDFAASKYVTPNEYLGSIFINSSTSGSRRIPVVIDVNPFVLDFKVLVNVSDKYKTVRPGNVVKANITLENLKDAPQSNITLYYSVKDLDGKVYNYSEENVSLSNNLNLERALNVPAGSPSGTYLFYARATLGNFTTISSDTFNVGARFNFEAVFKYGSIASAIFLLSAFSIILFLKYRREKEKDRLLNLYLMLTELKKLIKEGDVENAIQLYIRVKSAYGEPVSKTALENKTVLRQEIENLSKRLQQDVQLADSKTQNEIKNAATSTAQPQQSAQPSSAAPAKPTQQQPAKSAAPAQPAPKTAVAGAQQPAKPAPAKTASQPQSQATAKKKSDNTKKK